MNTRKIVPVHHKTLIRLWKVPTTHIRTNLTTAGVSRSRYFELLDSMSK